MKNVKVIWRAISNSRKNQQVISNLTHPEINAELQNVLPYKAIPGPKPLPLLGNTWRFIPFIGDFQIEHIDKVSRKLHERYGNIVKMEGLLGRPDMVFLFDPDDIEMVYRQEDSMPFRPSMPSLDYYKHVYRKDFFGDDNCGVIAVHGQKWQNFRSKVNQIMLQPRNSRTYFKSILSTALEFIERIETIKDDNDEVPPDFLNEIHKWSLESIAKIALDVRLGCLTGLHDNEDAQKLIDAVNTFFINVPILELKTPFWKLWNTPTFQKYIQALDTIREITMKHVNVALTDLDRTQKEPSVLQQVLQMDNDVKTASNLALDLFLVGIDTTSNAVASILYQLALHQQKQEILYEQIAKVLSECNASYEKFDEMTYLKACIKETMRMFPVVIGNGRCTTSDRIIAGYQIPKGVQVIFQHYVASNMDRNFPKSGEFLPERWLEGCEFHKKHPFASLPFGFGKRMCLGRRFADLEIQTIVAMIVKHYKIEYDYEELDYHIHPMYTPNGPLKLKFVKRKL